MSEDIIPRLPKEINKTLSEKLEKINDKSWSGNKETIAFDIQRLQNELRVSMRYHIGLVPEPGKLMLIKQFP